MSEQKYSDLIKRIEDQAKHERNHGEQIYAYMVLRNILDEHRKDTEEETLEGQCDKCGGDGFWKKCECQSEKGD